MSDKVSGIFNFADRLQMASLTQRATRQKVITANIANAETPGFRALGYDFEAQLQAVAGQEGELAATTSDPRHLRNPWSSADGSMRPDVYIRPTESIGQDGNTVDVDKEMADLAQNEILYRSAVEIINRKLATVRYAINGGR